MSRNAVLAALLSAVAIGAAPPLSAQAKPGQRPPWADVPGEPDTYPYGDAVDVYRAVLDQLYIDGKEHPKVIVLWDTTVRHGNGPCPWEHCGSKWQHKSTIDTATVLAFARQSVKRPRMTDFAYKIRIARVADEDFARLRNDGYAVLAPRPPDKIGFQDAFWAGFRQKFPAAWGYVALSKVGFNPQHTEALISVFQVCGESCRSNEIMFLKRFGKEWRVIERVTDYTDGMQAGGNLHYRGPAAEKAGESQIVAVDSLGSRPRAESEDAAKVYAAVLDKLYSMNGEQPRQLVLTHLHARSFGGLLKHRSAIDSSTIESYNLFTQIQDATPRFKYRIPIEWITDTALAQLAISGVAVQERRADVFESDQNALWYGFNAKYPAAWGYASLGRVAFNPKHTQALVFTRHYCGNSCSNGDTWFLERKNDYWYVVERMPQENQMLWTLDGLRYLGADAIPTWYRPRRLHGMVIDFATGQPLPNFPIMFQRASTSTIVVSDSTGAYALENPRVGPLSAKQKCPDRLGGAWMFINPLNINPGMDSTVNVQVALDICAHQ